MVVARCCQRAHAAGVKQGMPLVMARILTSTAQGAAPELALLNHQGDFLALCQLARWARKFTPLVALDEELILAWRSNTLPETSPLSQGLLLDVSGTERLHHGVATLARKLQLAFERKGFTARIATAPSIGAAWASARFGRSSLAILDPQVQLEVALATLPVEALRLPSGTVRALRQVGIERIQELLKLPRASLAQRFGPAVGLRLEQLLGLRSEALHFFKNKGSLQAERTFDIPLTSPAALYTVACQLLTQVLATLSAGKKKAACFHVEIDTLDIQRRCTTLHKELSLLHASSRESHLMSVLQPILEALPTGEGVSALRVTARLTSPATEEQLPLTRAQKKDTNSHSQPAHECLNQLLVRLGRERVCQAGFEASWVPEHSFSYRPIQPGPPAIQEPQVAAERPPYFLQPPQPVEVLALLPDAPPARICWQGQPLKILRGQGPERICLEWWQTKLNKATAPDSRDYFRVQDETGRWLWVFREQRSAQWFIHGIWV